jgi:hypothetical protein
VCPSLPANNRPELVDVTCECAHWPIASCGGTNWSCGGGRPSSMLPPRYNPRRETVSLRAYSPWVPDSQTNRWRYIYTAERKCQVQPHPLPFHENIIVLVPWARGVPFHLGENTDARVPPPAICDPSWVLHVRPLCGHGIGTSAYLPPPLRLLAIANCGPRRRSLSFGPRLLPCPRPAIRLPPPPVPSPDSPVPGALRSAFLSSPSSHHYLCDYFPLAWNHVRFMW